MMACSLSKKTHHSLVLLFTVFSLLFFVPPGKGDICPEPDNGTPTCFPEVCTWISRYEFHNSRDEIEEAFSRLSLKGINCIYFNVWADGNVYFESITARSMNVTVRDVVQFAVESSVRHNVSLYLWFEYGSTAGYGDKLSPFAQTAADFDWLLMNADSYYGANQGLFTYLDSSLQDVQKFIASLMLDALSNYDITGIQLDDHFLFPNGYDKTDALTTEQKYRVSQNSMQNIASIVKTNFPDKVFSYAPSPLHIALQYHNIDWQEYFNMTNGPDEIVPQYYRTSFPSFIQTLNTDFKLLPNSSVDSMGVGLRLSGTSEPQRTNCSEVYEMIKESERRGFKKISFWFASDLMGDEFSGLDRLFTSSQC